MNECESVDHLLFFFLFFLATCPPSPALFSSPSLSLTASLPPVVPMPQCVTSRSTVLYSVTTVSLFSRVCMHARRLSGRIFWHSLTIICPHFCSLSRISLDVADSRSVFSDCSRFCNNSWIGSRLVICATYDCSCVCASSSMLECSLERRCSNSSCCEFIWNCKIATDWSRDS